MKLLISSYFFFPTPGGISTSTYLLAREFIKGGHEVRIITTSTGEQKGDLGPNVVIRAPSWIELIRQVAWCDVVLSIHVSIRLTWPLFFNRRPWVVAHHSWLTEVDGSVGWVEKIKLRLLRFASCISISQAVADHVGGSSVVIGPPHDDSIFRPTPEIVRRRDLLFVGRLVSSKGVNVLLGEMDDLRRRGSRAKLTVVGDGPEMTALQDKVRVLELGGQVRFAGPLAGTALRNMFCSHRVLVVPSIGPETFGIVAVEAIACGCVVAGSDAAGGLGDAIGPCGPRFKRGDTHDLANCVSNLLGDPVSLAGYRQHAKAHVAQFTAQSVAGRYLGVVESELAKKRMTNPTALFHWFCLPSLYKSHQKRRDSHLLP